MDPGTVALVVCFAVCFAAAATDAVTGKIPNAITYPGIVAGLLLGLWAGGLAGLGLSLLAMAIAAVPFLLAFIFGGGGGGDVKIMAAVGALLGFPDILVLMAHALLIGAVMGLALLLWHKRLGGLWSRLRLAYLTLPLGPARMLNIKPAARDPQTGALIAPATAARARAGVRFGIAVALALVWINIPGMWRLPGL